MDELQIIQAAQKGNLAAFNRLVMAYQGLAYNIAYRLLGDSEAAADATQDAFIKAFRAIKQYHGGSFKSWLLRIVSNTCYDQMRYHKRRPTEALDTADAEVESDHNPHLIDNAEPPEEVVERHEMGTMLQNAIQQIPEDQRLVLVLSDVEGLPYQEIADITGLALGTIKSRLSRARRKMRDILRQEELLPQIYRQ